MTELFVVRHYSNEDRPIIKGNGFDGLEVGETREEAEAFIKLINERLTTQDDDSYNHVPMKIVGEIENTGLRMQAVPEGMVLVPREPTEAMKNAGGHANSEWLNDNAPIGEARYSMPMESVWRAMIAAEQSVPVRAAPVNQPLTENQIIAIANRITQEWVAWQIKSRFVTFARAIEREHGIK